MSTPKLYPALWFDQNGVEAAKLYCSVFDDSIIINESELTVTFELSGYYIIGINGGSKYRPNPAVSLYVTCVNEEEINTKFKILSEDGIVMMAPGTYPWSSYYTFFEDKFGVSWQLTLSEDKSTDPKFIPSLLFANQKNGKAKTAVELYTSIFKNTVIEEISYYGENQGNTCGNVLFSRFTIEGFPFIAMDAPGNHNFDFNEGFSFVITTKDQNETDYFWNMLTANGGEELPCGWLRDPFGICWQVIPERFSELISSGSPDQKQRIFQAMQLMKKLIISDLEKAAYQLQ